MQLRPEDGFMEKLIQTYEMMIVRHGFMMVGHPLGGKTSLLHLLARTLCRQNELGQDEERVEYETVNPKALTMGQLYGCFDDVSHEWSDGVVANTFRCQAWGEGRLTFGRVVKCDPGHYTAGEFKARQAHTFTVNVFETKCVD